MAKTWSINKVVINKEADTVTVVLQEGIDGTPTEGRLYSSDPISRKEVDVAALINASIKEKVLMERERETDEATAEAYIDLANFEQFVKA